MNRLITPFTAALRSAKVGDVFWTEQRDIHVWSAARRFGLKCKTQNFWAVPTAPGGREKATQAIRLCQVTVLGKEGSG